MDILKSHFVQSDGIEARWAVELLLEVNRKTSIFDMCYLSLFLCFYYTVLVPFYFVFCSFGLSALSKLPKVEEFQV
jgi:NADH:ubiquinone oxidoreductase subunit 4 (subunit M)